MGAATTRRPGRSSRITPAERTAVTPPMGAATTRRPGWSSRITTAGNSAACHTTRAAVPIDRTRLTPPAGSAARHATPRGARGPAGPGSGPAADGSGHDAAAGPVIEDHTGGRYRGNATDGSGHDAAAGLVIEDHTGGQLGSTPHDAGRGADRPHQVDAPAGGADRRSVRGRGHRWSCRSWERTGGQGTDTTRRPMGAGTTPAAGLVIGDHDGGQLGSMPHEAGRGADRPHQVDARGRLEHVMPRGARGPADPGSGAAADGNGHDAAAGLVIEDHTGGQLGSMPHDAGRGADRPHQVDARGRLGST